MTRPGWDDPALIVTSDTARTARYRRLQSWYREVQLGAAPGSTKRRPAIGSRLSLDDVAAQPDLNFIHPSAYAHAKQRALEVQREGGTLEVGRLKHNMLSSMPLCFNLFGAIGNEPVFLALFRHLFDGEAISIIEVICEWMPPSPSGRLGDRTAFDAVIRYERSDGPAVFGIETKYTEPFSKTGYKPTKSNRYREITTDCGWFADPEGALERLQRPASNQLWRNLMLAGAIDMAGTRGAAAVVALTSDPGAAKAITLVSAELRPEFSNRLTWVGLEEIVDAVSEVAPELCGWADRFSRRYLDTNLPDDPATAADPGGPRLGHLLTRP